MKFRRILLLWIAVTLLSLMTACTALQGQNQAPSGAEPDDNQKVKIRLALLPIIDTLPIYAAQKEGFFAKQNLEVELIPAGSAAERDQIIQAKQADGMINDLVSVTLYNKDSIQVVVVSLARVAGENNSMYRILAARNSGIQSAADLVNVPVGVSQGTVIDYLTTRMLEKAGLKTDQIKTIAVPKMDQRLALLQSGELKAATLPEPFATLAVQNGAVVILDDVQSQVYSNSVISFRKEFVDQHPSGVKRFLAAVNEAAAAINANGEKFRPLLAEYKLIPPTIQSSYPIPTFPTPSWPTRDNFNDASAWAKARGLIHSDVAYDQSVTGEYLKP